MQQSQPRRRRRAGSTDAQQRSCPHCGRSFKRSEHLDRHVRTHTKEKPYICHCGSAYSRRDLLTRHQRITHENATPQSPDDAAPSEGSNQTPTDSEPPSSASASSLPDLSMNQWHQQHQYLDQQSQPMSDPNHPVPQPFHHTLPSQDFYDHSRDGAGYDNMKEFTDFVDPGAMPLQWNPYYYDASSGQNFVDPSLQGFMYDGSGPIAYGDRAETYNH